ncbi:MAG TPA: PDZ domain-containing protein [Planctomycetota bacterium]|nr:PDZ domain-containing protein [Planctomycetota bacterium]
MIDVRACVVIALALCVNLPAQEPEPAPTPQTPPAVAETRTKGVEHWIRDLGSDSFQTRLKAEGALRKLGKEALPALKKAADDADSEVQWRARRLLRQIEKGTNQGLVERPKKEGTEPEVTEQDESQGTPQTRFWRVPQGFPDVREQFESLFERFERDFGLDIPRARFFEDDFFKDLQEQMKAGRGTSQGTVLQIGPGGSVHVEISERNEKGEVEKKVYDAPDMQSFQQQYPDVLKKSGLYLGLNEWPRSLRGFGGQAWPGFKLQPGWKLEPGWQPYGQLLPDAQDDLLAPATPAPVGKRLGIVVHPVPAELREHLDLEPDTGLMVESVQEGSLAESLGLQRGDIVVQIESTPIGSSMDVQKVLGGIEAGKQVEVKFLRKGKEKAAKATKTEAVEESKKLEAKKGKNATIR